MEKAMARGGKWRNLFGDTVWSLLAIVLMNATLQLAVYPAFSRRLGSEKYGDVLYLLGLVNIVSVSFGCSANNRRMRESISGETANGDYNCILIAMMAMAIPFAAGVALWGGVAMPGYAAMLYWVLICATMLRNYSDVGFRLALVYRKYFFYYFSVSAGYVLGIFLFFRTGYWVLAILPGEFAGCLYCLVKSDIYRKAPLACTERLRGNVRGVTLLVLAQLVINIILNSDRMVLKLTLGGAAVTTYYLASLLGKTLAMVTTPLNSVIIGHLAKYKGKFTRRMLYLILGALFACAIVGAFVCTGFSHIFVHLLYPQNYADAKPYFFVANLSQLVFFSSSILNTVLLCFAPEQYQLYINIAFVGAFLTCLPATHLWGIRGFSYGMLFATSFRFLVAILFAMRVIKKNST